MTFQTLARDDATLGDDAHPSVSVSASIAGSAAAHASDVSHTSGDGIRELLRDSALLVTRLSQGGQAKDAGALRQRCRQLMATFSAALSARGFSAQVREDAEYAQCGLLDEAALRCLDNAKRPVWDAQPLQVERFGKHDAGERVFERLEQRMCEATPNIALLEAYAAVLALGFKGRYAREGETKRVALIADLNAQIEQLRPDMQGTFVADRRVKRLVDWFYRLSPWGIAGLACAAGVVVWLICNTVLDAQLAQLAPNAIQP